MRADTPAPQACLSLPLEDINARQMLEEGVALLAKLDPAAVSERALSYDNASGDALRAVWPQYASALDVGTPLTPLPDLPLPATPGPAAA